MNPSCGLAVVQLTQAKDHQQPEDSGRSAWVRLLEVEPKFR